MKYYRTSLKLKVPFFVTPITLNHIGSNDSVPTVWLLWSCLQYLFR